MIERRHFGKSEKIALWLAADGKSAVSGKPLGEDWHADHVLPWSKGGVTDVLNGQALTASENLRKGARVVNLRSWQRRFVDTYNNVLEPDFLLAALPGGGKTIAALHCAREFLNHPTRKLIIVVPTSNLREQWRDEASSVFGIQLQTMEFRGALKVDFDGVVTTYAAVASQPMLFRHLCGTHECMVVFDEVHHAGDRSTWGSALKQAFEAAKKRLSLTGTPFRSDGDKIPFLQVNSEGFYRIDFPYDYPSALTDGVVREVVFHRYGGSVTLAIGEEVVEFHTSDDSLDDDEVALRLRKLLQSENFTKGLLREAHERLLKARETKPNAGALALCIDANHAVHVSKLLREITGEQPDIIISDDEVANSNVKDFRKSDRKWVVAVKMVSEGVDIKRLMVLAYLTNVTSELFFRQAVGRVVRSEGTDYDLEAYCVIPDDKRLSKLAETIEEWQRQALHSEEDDDDDVEPSTREAPGERVSVSILDSSDASYEGMIARGSHYEVDKATQIAALALHYKTSSATVASLWEHFRQMESQDAVNVAAPTAEVAENLEEKLTRLRRECHKKANQLAAIRKTEPREINAEYMRIANLGQREMTASQLEAKKQWLMKKIAEAKAQGRLI